jgi:hypothetical protein
VLLVAYFGWCGKEEERGEGMKGSVRYKSAEVIDLVRNLMQKIHIKFAAENASL